MPWDEGYNSQIEYNRGYFSELNPLAMKLSMLAHGYQPLPTDRPLRYLELGFGQGLSFNIHAAACDGEFWGNDFMPSHANAAKTMAEFSGATVTVLDDSFAELAARDDLPEFDIIALHGVWSWISSENHRHILKIIESKLALGGIVYISYNVTPGRTAMLPVRDLMLLHMNTVSPVGSNISTKIKDALAFMNQLLAADAAYFGKTPEAVVRFKDMLNEPSLNYLAHEYFNADWPVMPFSEVASLLTSCGLTFCGQARIKDFFAPSFLPAQISTFLADIKNPLFRESVSDFCVNKSFRSDIWVKGGRLLSPLRQLAALADMHFVLVGSPFVEEDLELMTCLGKLTLDKNLATPVLAALADNNAEPKSINRLLGYPSLKHLNLSQACDLVLSLCGVCVSPAQDEETATLCKPRTDKLNAFLINQSKCADYAMNLASPITGGGIPVSRFHQLSLLALKEGLSTVEEVADFIWRILSAQGQSVMQSDGTPCKDRQENVRALTSHVAPFFESHLPALTALKIS